MLRTSYTNIKKLGTQDLKSS